MSQVKYTQITVECAGCPAVILDSPSEIGATLRLVAKVSSLHVLKEDFHQFKPQGITGYVLLSESHISIHTWPEEQFAIVDILSCAIIDEGKITKCLQRCLQPTAINISSNSRKLPSRKSLVANGVRNRRQKQQAAR